MREGLAKSWRSTARLETNMCEPISKFANEYMLRASVSYYDAIDNSLTYSACSEASGAGTSSHRLGESHR